jgi:hypothetical protein
MLAAVQARKRLGARQLGAGSARRGRRPVLEAGPGGWPVTEGFIAQRERGRGERVNQRGR